MVCQRILQVAKTFLQVPLLERVQSRNVQHSAVWNGIDLLPSVACTCAHVEFNSSPWKTVFVSLTWLSPSHRCSCHQAEFVRGSFAFSGMAIRREKPDFCYSKVGRFATSLEAQRIVISIHMPWKVVRATSSSE